MTTTVKTDTAELTLPPESVFNKEDLERFTAIAEANNLSREDTQTLIDLAVGCSQRSGEAAIGRLNKSFADARALWRSIVFEDPEIGGENSAASKRYATQAIEKFGTPDLDFVFNSGWGDHPAIVRFCVNIGKFLADHAEAKSAGAETHV